MLPISDEERKKLIPKSGVGRPSVEITDKMIHDAGILSGQGLTYKQIAGYFGICPVTFYRKLNEYPELRQALVQGKSKMISLVAGELIRQIKDGSTTSTIFYLKTQAGWKEPDPTQPNPDEKDDEPLEPLDLKTKDPNEAAKAYQQIMLRD